MWEEYIERASASVPNKYRRRRFKARVRGELLSHLTELRGRGLDNEAAMREAMALMGEPETLIVRLAEAEPRQQGWLWTLSVTELAVGLAIMLASMHSEYLAGMAVGRVVSLWGVVATVLNSRHPGRIRQAFRSLRAGGFAPLPRMAVKAVFLGALSGGLGALFTIMPWNLIDNNVVDPMVLSEVSMGVLALAIALVPWMIRRSWREALLRSVALQVYAGTGGAVAYATLLWWHPGLVPPPFFNWNPPLMVVAGFLAYFGSVRLYRFVLAIERPLDPWEERDLPEAM